MKALRVEAPGKARVVEIDAPVRNSGDEVLLQVRMVGMCGSDLTTFRGTNPMVSYPRILGHEIAATVLDAGSSGLQEGVGVTLSPYTACGVCAACKRGRSNACAANQTLGVQRDGAMVDVISVPASKIYTAALDMKSLCMVEPLTVGAHAVRRGRVTSNDVVAVYGCGGVGLGAIAAAAFRGATVVAIDMDEKKLQTARKAGAKHLIDVSHQDAHTLLQELSGGLGPDVVIEAIGTPRTFQSAVEEVAFTGRVVYIGYAKEPVAYETRLFVQKELDILGARNAQPEDFSFVIQMLEAGSFPIEEAVTVTAPLEEAPRLLEEWNAAPGRFQKIIIDMQA